MDMDKITRGPAYTPGKFSRLGREVFAREVSMIKTSPVDSLWLHEMGLMVRCGAAKARCLSANEVGLAALEMARDIPDLRRALIDALTALEGDSK
jgi:hypothetical protein